MQNTNLWSLVTFVVLCITIQGCDAFTRPYYEGPDIGSSPTPGVEIGFTRIPAGSFMMGSNNGESDESPAHEVIISHDFFMSVYETTQGQYEAIMGLNPTDQMEAPDLPVEDVSWFDAVRFANAYSLRQGLDPCYDREGNVLGDDLYQCNGYRLPTEAEWEYAARAGATTAYSFGDEIRELKDYAWYSESLLESGTHTVGQKKPNQWGLFDMHGNAWEWVHDRYGQYQHGTFTDPVGPETGAAHVVRGGGWYGEAKGLRSAVRNPIYAYGAKDASLGFRLARTIK